MGCRGHLARRRRFGEARARGDLVAAFVAGWEVAARVGIASRGTFHKRGFHTTSIGGVFGGRSGVAAQFV